MAEGRVYENYAWILIFVTAIAALVFSAITLLGIPVDPQGTENVTGMTPSELEAAQPDIYQLILSSGRATGLALLVVGVVGMAIAAVPYRRGEKWAWYTIWIVPIAALGYLANDVVSSGTLWWVFIVLFIVPVLGLLLPFRMFFART